jgi:hypothetical protein
MQAVRKCPWPIETYGIKLTTYQEGKWRSILAQKIILTISNKINRSIGL